MTGQWTQHFWHIIAPSLWSPVLILLFCSGSHPRLEHLHSWENEHKRNCPDWPFWENKTKIQTFLFPPRLPRNKKTQRLSHVFSSALFSNENKTFPGWGSFMLHSTFLLLYLFQKNPLERIYSPNWKAWACPSWLPHSEGELCIPVPPSLCSHNGQGCPRSSLCVCQGKLKTQCAVHFHTAELM